MSEILYAHIAKLTGIDQEEFASIIEFFEPLEVKKKQLLVSEGHTCNANYFVVKGCLRMFFMDDTGTEQTIQFAVENWWMTDLDAFNKRTNASFSIQAMENSQLLAINKTSWDKLLRKHLVMEKYFRLIYERAYAASLFRVKYIFRLSKEEFYELFSGLYPEFIQRIPQKILASFLGFTPEYLSELRKKKAAKQK